MSAHASAAKTLAQKYDRYLLLHVWLTMTASGMRTGEVAQLRNENVRVHKKASECVVSILAPTSKRKKERTITLRGVVPAGGGNPLIDWINEYQIHKSPGDYVFASFKSGRKQGNTDFGSIREQLVERSVGYVTMYHGRHSYIGKRLKANENIAIISEVCGTSPKMIQQTYHNVLTEIASREFTKKRVVYDEEGGHKVIES